MRQAKTFSHRSILFKTFSSFISLFFFVSSVFIHTPVHAQTINTPVFMPTVGSMVNTSSSFAPLIVRGITFDNDNPLSFSFLVDPGQTNFSDEQLRDESQRLINYFMAALTVPEQELWVNLSPYESERVIPDSLGQTAMGRDLLAQDYLLKQFTASLMYPESELGRMFWDNVKEKVRTAYGSDVEIPTDVYNKVWITPESAKIYIHEQSVFLTESRLKVMLEEDYLAQKQNIAIAQQKVVHSQLKDIIKEIIIPEIEKEVNTGEHFAPLRQVFQSVILASWYKNNLKQTLFAQVYADQNKVKGINENDPANNTVIYERYLEAFDTGVYNYIKEEYDAATQRMIPSKYFSGGVAYNNRAVFSHPDSATLGEYNQPLNGADASVLEDELRRPLIAVDVQALENVVSVSDVFEQPRKRPMTSSFVQFLGDNRFAAVPEWNNHHMWLTDLYDHRLLVMNLTDDILSRDEKLRLDEWLVQIQNAEREDDVSLMVLLVGQVEEQLDRIIERYIGDSPNGVRQGVLEGEVVDVEKENLTRFSFEQKFDLIREFSTLNMVMVMLRDLARWDVFSDAEEQRIVDVVKPQDGEMTVDLGDVKVNAELRQELEGVVARLINDAVTISLDDNPLTVRVDGISNTLIFETEHPQLNEADTLPPILLAKIVRHVHPMTRNVTDASTLNHNQVFEINPANPQLARYRGHMVEDLLRYRQEVVDILDDGKVVEKPTIILTDLHGASMRLGQLLSKIFDVDVQIEFDPETGRARTLASQGVNLESIKDMEFYIGGDVFDRGPYGFLVFDIVRELAEAGAIVIPGNHEDMAIGAILNVDRGVEISDEMERVAWASWAKKWATYVSSSGSFSWGRTVIDERNRELLLQYHLEKEDQGSVARILSRRSPEAIRAAGEELFDKFTTEERRLDKDGSRTDAEIQQIVEDKISSMSNFEKVNAASYALKIREFNKIHKTLSLEPIETALPGNMPVDAENFRRDPRFREVVEFYATHNNVRLFHETKSGVLITHGGVAVDPENGVIPIEVSEGVSLTGKQYTRGLKIYEAAYKKGLQDLLELDLDDPNFTAKKDAVLEGDMRFVREYMDGMYSDYTRDGKIKSRQNPQEELKPANWANFVSADEYRMVVKNFIQQQKDRGLDPGDDNYIDLDQLVKDLDLTFNGFGLKNMTEQLGVNMLSFGHNPINSNYPDRPAKLDKPLEIIKFVFLRAAYETGVALDLDLKMSEGYGPHGGYAHIDEDGIEVTGYENSFSKKEDIKTLVAQAEGWQKVTFYDKALAYIDGMFKDNPYVRMNEDGDVTFFDADGRQIAKFNGNNIISTVRGERDENAPAIGVSRSNGVMQGDEQDNSALSPTPVGGIDLNLEGMDLQIKRDASGVPLPIEQQPLMDMQIDGFLPVIINITPVSNVPLMLGLGGSADTEESASPYTDSNIGNLSHATRPNRIAAYASYY